MAGEAVADRGRGTERAASGGPVSSLRQPLDLVLWGVELVVDEVGEDVVRVSDGVLVRASGRRREMFRSLSNGEAW